MSTDNQDSTTGRSAANVLALRLIAVAAILVLLVVAFFLGRATAPNASTNTAAGSTSPSTSTPRDLDSPTSGDSNGAKSVLAGFVSETGLVPGSDFAPSVSEEGGRQAIQILIDGANHPDRTLGNPNAPITLTVLGDFSCPMCTTWERNTLPELQKYLDDGTVKMQWHNMVIFADQYRSDLAAHGAIAAMNQGKLWEYVREAYASAGEGNHPSYTEDLILEIAGKAGIPDLGRFKSDMQSPETQATIDEETQSAQSVGVNGTPFFVLGDSIISGAYPAEFFQNTIEYQKYLAKNS